MDPMDFSALFADQSPDAKREAMLSALRRQQAGAQLGLLSGDKVLGGYGQQMMRAGAGDELAAQRLEMARQNMELQQQRTRAYEEAMRSAAEARDKGYSLREQEIGLKREGQALKRAAGAAAQAAAKTKAGEKLSGLEMPFYGGDFVPRLGVAAYRDSDVSEAKKISGLYNSALTGMDSIEKSLTEYAQAPSNTRKNVVDSKVQAVATALNAAFGQGAMSDSEKRAISGALGADVTSKEGLYATIKGLLGDGTDTSGADALLSRLRSVREVSKEQAIARLKPFNFEFRPKVAPAPLGKPKVRTMYDPKTGQAFEVED